mgnify:CR=1 FL=1
MKREEEIEKASEKYIEYYLKSSNEYPLCDNRKRMSLIQVDLYKMQEAFENGMKEADKTMLDRACEWLRFRVSVDVPIETNENGEPLADSWIKAQMERVKAAEELIAEFRKAMEGGAE